MSLDLNAPVIFDKQQLLITQMLPVSCFFRFLIPDFLPNTLKLNYASEIVSALQIKKKKNNSTAKRLNFHFRASSHLLKH
jgi:hypothetical protein